MTVGDLDNTTTKAKRQRQRLTVVVAFEPELPEVEVAELEDDLLDLLLGMVAKRQGGSDVVQSDVSSEDF